MSVDIGIDLGTASVLVYVRGKGVILKEPSVVAYDRDTNEIKAIGEEARLMLGRTPGNIVASSTALRSTSVIPLGTQILITGFLNVRRPMAF